MCGIAGLWGRGIGDAVWRLAAPLGPALRHRGPDDAGWLAAWPREGHTRAVRELDAARSGDAPPPEVVLAHRRLSIVDLETGWQPLANETGSVWIVYNGEIYNHLALRQELEALGHRFSTRSDTEMVVHAYEAWGPDAFARFNGIFAFALWDVSARRLLLARDPLGVKPLYHGAAPHALWFASEVKAAIQAELCAPSLNRSALDLYLAYRFVPSPDTLFRGVARVPPGHWVEASGAGEFWGPAIRFAPDPRPEDRAARVEEWVERLSAATRGAVAGQLMADVPVGALLSGGLDSSIVVSAMSEQQSAPVATYAIGFGGARLESELRVAERAATALHTLHHGVELDQQTFFREWIDAIWQIDEPVATPGHVLVSILCRRVARDLKVVLTGQGADEPLGGYLRHTVERWIRVLGWRPVASALRASANVMRRSEAVQRLAGVATETDEARRIVAAFAVFTPEQRERLLTPASRAAAAPEAPLQPVRRWLQGTEGLDSLNRLLYVDARLSLADDLLLGADKVAMASSVEARVPFLDLGYLAVAERIPGRLKISWLQGRKHLQHLVAHRLLPPALARDLAGLGSGWRKKRGFDEPSRQWFRHESLPKVGQWLVGSGAALPEYLEGGAIARLLEEHGSGRVDHTRQLTALLTLEAWHRCFIGGDAASLRQSFAGGEADHG